MQNSANNTLFVTDWSSLDGIVELTKGIGHRGFYQQFGRTIIKDCIRRLPLVSLADNLTSLAGQAYAFRHQNLLRQITEALLQLPLPRTYEIQSRYYHGLSLRLEGREEEALRELELVAAGGPPDYKARAIMSMGAIALRNGNLKSALYLSIEAGKASVSNGFCDPMTVVAARRNICIVQSIEGNHRESLAGLQETFGLARIIASVNPCILFEHLNSLAVELLSLGRIEEARNVSAKALRSPYAQAYPEWHDTSDEIRKQSWLPSRSFVAIGQPHSDPNEAPCYSIDTEPTVATQLQRSLRSGSLLIFPARTESPRPRPVRLDPHKVTPDELDRMPVSEKRAMLQERTFREDFPADMYDKLLRAAGLVIEQDQPKQIDLESPGVLENMIALWINGEIDPEEFAGVISALRDCDDDLRRQNIMDRMITCAFRESHHSAECEENWRNRIEARLKPVPSQS